MFAKDRKTPNKIQLKNYKKLFVVLSVNMKKKH